MNVLRMIIFVKMPYVKQHPTKILGYYASDVSF